MHTFTLTDDEREMIIEALRAYESEYSGFATSTPEGNEYFAKVLLLADRIGHRPAGWNAANKWD